MTWALVDNPAYAGRAAAPLEAACHDRTPFVEVDCICGARQHYHESQLEHVPPTSGIEGRCSGCGDALRFPPGMFANAFADMRRRGWLAPRGAVSVAPYPDPNAECLCERQIDCPRHGLQL